MVAYMRLTLSAREQSAIASCFDTMVRPFDYPSLDAWRTAVLDAISQVVHTEADAVGLILDEPSSGIAASIELHSARLGTPAFGPRGVAIMQLLLPSFRAGLCAVDRGHSVHGRLAEVLNASGSALRAFDRRGACVHQTPRVDSLLQDNPQRADVLAQMALLARHAAAPATSCRDGSTARCMAEITTSSAAYRIEATRVSSFGAQGTIILVAIESLAPTPIGDAVLRSRYHLSPREIAVAREIARGVSAQEIASALAISVHTVRRHSERVFTKLGVHSRAAVAAALSR